MRSRPLGLFMPPLKFMVLNGSGGPDRIDDIDVDVLEDDLKIECIPMKTTGESSCSCQMAVIGLSLLFQTMLAR